MFDTIRFRCPSCGGAVYRQTKSGPCDLKTFDERGVPVAVAAGALNNEVLCEPCQITFVVLTRHPRIELYLVEKTNDEDEP